MSESWSVIGIETDVPFGKTIREWVEAQGFASYKDADQYRLVAMLRKPKVNTKAGTLHFFVRRVES
jgi:hypothetical protein